AVSSESAFVPFRISGLAVTNADASLPPTHAFGGRVVIIADKPLLESSTGPGDVRLLTIYGRANTIYETQYSTNAGGGFTWAPAWTNTLPVNLFYSQVLTGSYSQAPLLLLRAREN